MDMGVENLYIYNSITLYLEFRIFPRETEHKI